MQTIEQPKRNILPYLALAAGVASLSFSALFVRWANAPGPVVSLYRMVIATAILAPVFVRARRSLPPLSLKLLIFPLMAGAFSALDHAVWSTSIMMTRAANATLLNNTAPLWVALAAWLVFRERLAGKFWLGLGLTMTGAAVVLGMDFLLHPTLGWGDLLALGSGVFYAGYFIWTQFGRRHWQTLPFVWLANVSCALVLLAVSLVLGLPLSGYPLQTYLMFAAAAIVSQVFGYLSLGYALGHLPASLVAPTLILQPVVTALIAIPLLGEYLHLWQIVGGGTVLVGIFLVHKSRQESSEQMQEKPAQTAAGVYLEEEEGI
jgi:drug/metabolite transporter (DMT)-like permease